MSLCRSVNMLLSDFNNIASNILVNIFKSYCTSLYGIVLCDIRGGPFDAWGGYGFSFGIKHFFSTPSLNVQFFSDLIKSKQFFSQR